MDRHSYRIGIRAGSTSLLSLLVVLAATPLAAQNADPTEVGIIGTEAYLTPPEHILEAAMAPRWERVNLGNLNPSGEWFLRTLADGFPTVAQYAKKSYDLGQFQVDPLANRHRRLSRLDEYGFELISADGQTRRQIEVPDGAWVSNPTWSPDGTRLAYFAHFDDATHIYVADPANGRSRQVTRTPVLAMNVTSFFWISDGEEIVTVLLPENRGPEPMAPAVPETPWVRVTTPDRNRLRTYFDLLESPHEIELVKYFSTGQLAKIEVDSRDVETIGEPAMIESVNASPDGMYLRVTTTKDDFSYIVPTSNAGSTEEIWDASGNVLTELDDSDVNESVINGDGGGGRAPGSTARSPWRRPGP